MVVEVTLTGTDSVTVQNWFREPMESLQAGAFLLRTAVGDDAGRLEAQVVWHGTAGVDSFIGIGSSMTPSARRGNDQAWGHGRVTIRRNG